MNFAAAMLKRADEIATVPQCEFYICNKRSKLCESEGGIRSKWIQSYVTGYYEVTACPSKSPANPNRCMNSSDSASSSVCFDNLDECRCKETPKNYDTQYQYLLAVKKKSRACKQSTCKGIDDILWWPYAHENSRKVQGMSL